MKKLGIILATLALMFATAMPASASTAGNSTFINQSGTLQFGAVHNWPSSTNYDEVVAPGRASTSHVIGIYVGASTYGWCITSFKKISDTRFDNYYRGSAAANSHVGPWVNNGSTYTVRTVRKTSYSQAC